MGHSSSDLGVARRMIDAHEASIDTDTRRTRGVHYTPHDIAAMLARRSVDRVQERLGRLPRTVLDPACGSGALLLAVAQTLAERGLDPLDIVQNRLIGHDIDPDSVAVARAALSRWAGVPDVDPRPGDGLPGGGTNMAVRDVLDVSDGVSMGLHDLVIGNPPFLTQLRSSTALGPEHLEELSRHLGSMDRYVDASAVFLALAQRSLATGGVMCLIQPQSFLSNENARSVRNLICGAGGPIEIWSSPFMHFDAQVRVCAVIASEPLPSDAATTRHVEVHWSRDKASVGTTSVHRVRVPRPDESWGYMIAPAMGVPVLPGTTSTVAGRRSGEDGPDGVLGDLARTTAGFRDEYYALRDACVEESELRDVGGGPVDAARIVTTGLIRPGGCDWGVVGARIGGRTWDRPVVDPAATGDMKPRVGGWFRSRLVPKVLVATQSRIVEACADEDGNMVPMTPVISVEPLDGWETEVDPTGDHAVDIWWLVAALSAPSVSVAALTANLGSGLSPQSLRWSARSVGGVALPRDLDAWAAGAVAARALSHCDPRSRPDHLESLGHHMLAAHGLADERQVFEWWFDRACRA